jgi:hypothetical protein
MGPNYRAVQQEVFHIGIIGKGVVHPLPDAFLTPAEEAFIHGVPLAVLLRERPPLGARPGDPQDARKETAAVLFLPNVHVRTGTQEVQHSRPLVWAELFCSHTSNIKQNLK